jgi:hypothetical protein
MTEYTKNSAEASIELRAALHKLEQTMTSGVNSTTVGLAMTVQRLAVTLLESIVEERCAQIGANATLKHARNA